MKSAFLLGSVARRLTLVILNRIILFRVMIVRARDDLAPEVKMDAQFYLQRSLPIRIELPGGLVQLWDALDSRIRNSTRIAT